MVVVVVQLNCTCERGGDTRYSWVTWTGKDIQQTQNLENIGLEMIMKRGRFILRENIICSKDAGVLS